MNVSAVEKKCSATYQGIRFYRAKTWGWQDKLDAPRTKKSTKNMWAYSCKYGEWVRKLWKERNSNAKKKYENHTHALSVPVGEAALRVYVNDGCLEEIIDRETADTWSPTIYNYTGSGAYGLPQALPGHKMASAGSDWATNPVTQIRWMREYVNSRYGGSCNALAHHNANGWY